MSKIKHPTTHEERMKFNAENGLSLPVGEAFWTLYSALKGCLTNDEIYGRTRWNYERARRTITRFIYETSLTKPSSYQTKEARDILKDDLLDKEQKDKLTTDEHTIPPQVYAHFICWAWEKEFVGQLGNLVTHILTISQTIKSTVKQNQDLRSFTVNNKDTGNVLKVKCITQERYKKAGIDKLWNIDEGRYILEFPFILCDRFTEFEKEVLLIK
jgi:hypothetical protein